MHPRFLRLRGALHLGGYYILCGQLIATISARRYIQVIDERRLCTRSTFIRKEKRCLIRERYKGRNLTSSHSHHEIGRYLPYLHHQQSPIEPVVRIPINRCITLHRHHHHHHHHHRQTHHSIHVNSQVSSGQVRPTQHPTRSTQPPTHLVTKYPHHLHEGIYRTQQSYLASCIAASLPEP